jgi:DNA-binding MarR family transcriptional regulator
MIKPTVFNKEPARSGTEKIERLPPSAKLVYKVLETSDQITQKDIAARSYLPNRTVRYALGRLRAENLIVESFCFRDARQSLYGLQNSPAPASQ